MKDLILYLTFIALLGNHYSFPTSRKDASKYTPSKAVTEQDQTTKLENKPRPRPKPLARPQDGNKPNLLGADNKPENKPRIQSGNRTIQHQDGSKQKPRSMRKPPVVDPENEIIYGKDNSKIFFRCENSLN